MGGSWGQEGECGTALTCKGNTFPLLSGQHLLGRGCVTLQDSLETRLSSCDGFPGAHGGRSGLPEWRILPCSHVPRGVAIGGIHFCGARGRVRVKV